MHAGDRQQVHNAGQAHRRHQIIVQIFPAAEQHRLKERRLPAEHRFGMPHQLLLCAPKQLSEGKLAAAFCRPSGQKIAGKLVIPRQRANPPVDPTGIARLARRKQPARPLHPLADLNGGRGLVLLRHQRNQHAPRARFAVARRVLQPDAVLPLNRVDLADNLGLRPARRIANSQHRGRHAVAEQEKRQCDTKKRAFPPSQPKKTENRRKSAQKPNPNRGERRNLRQVNARQIGAGEHSQPTANRKQNHAPAFVHQPCLALLWYDGHKMPVSLLT